MLSTVLVIAIVLLDLILSFVLWAWFLRWGLQWMRAENVTNKKLIVVTLLIWVFSLVSLIQPTFLTDQPEPVNLLIEIGFYLGIILLILTTIAVTFRIGLFKAFVAWFPTLLATLIMFGVVALLIRPFLLEAF